LAPNPSTGSSSVLLNLNTESDVQIALVDLNGKLIAQGTYNNLSGAQSIALNLNGLAAGIYAVNVQVNGTQFTEKLVIE
jgi:hypothetical protein